MATKVVQASPLIPPGTAVRAYPAEACDYERTIGRVPFATAATDTGTTSSTDGTITITGTAGAYELVSVVDEVQTVTIDATSGQFKLTFQGQQTADIAFNVSAANLKTALAALSNLDAADLTTSGGPGDSGGTTPYIVTFGGQWAGQNVSAMTGVTGTTPLAGGGATVVIGTTTQGAPAVTGGPVFLRFSID